MKQTHKSNPNVDDNLLDDNIDDGDDDSNIQISVNSNNNSGSGSNSDISNSTVNEDNEMSAQVSDHSTYTRYYQK